MSTRKPKQETPKPHPETCEVCPYRYRDVRCPSWITAEYGFVEKNLSTGEERIVTGCFFNVIPKLMQHVVAAASGAQAGAEDLRNVVAKGFTILGKRQLIDHMEQKLLANRGQLTDGQ